MVILAVATLATAQQLQVDSVLVDSVWNSDSSWYTSQGIHQQRYSRDLYLSFKPMPSGGGMAQCFVAISIDSAKVWLSSSWDSLIVLDSGISSLIQCGTMSRVKIRVLGQDRPGVAFQVTAQQWQPIIAGNPQLVTTAALTPGDSCSVNLQCSLNNASQRLGFAPIVKVWWDAFGTAGTWSDSTATLSYTWQTTVPTGSSGQRRAMIAKARDANGLWSAPCTLTVQFGLNDSSAEQFKISNGAISGWTQSSNPDSFCVMNGVAQLQEGTAASIDGGSGTWTDAGGFVEAMSQDMVQLSGEEIRYYVMQYTDTAYAAATYSDVQTTTHPVDSMPGFPKSVAFGSYTNGVAYAQIGNFVFWIEMFGFANQTVAYQSASQFLTLFRSEIEEIDTL
jgi:hypothetical protein